MHSKNFAATAALIAFAAAAPALAATSASTPAPDDHVWHTFQATARPFTPALAPADEYFGRFKLSNLGMRNIIHDMNVEGDSPLALPLQQLRIHEVAGALSDWSNRYPRDKWLPGTTASFVKFLERKQTPETAEIAVGYAVYLVDRFNGTPSARWYVTLLSAHSAVPDVDPGSLPPAFRVYSPFDADVLHLQAPALP